MHVGVDCQFALWLSCAQHSGQSGIFVYHGNAKGFLATGITVLSLVLVVVRSHNLYHASSAALITFGA